MSCWGRYASEATAAKKPLRIKLWLIDGIGQIPAMHTWLGHGRLSREQMGGEKGVGECR